jgi:hypothetical protein
MKRITIGFWKMIANVLNWEWLKKTIKDIED